MGTLQECYELSWINPGSSTLQNSKLCEKEKYWKGMHFSLSCNSQDSDLHTSNERDYNDIYEYI